MLQRLSPHANVLYEKSTGVTRSISVFGGVEYQISAKVAVDVSAQRFGLVGSGIDRQVVVGMTANLGRIGRSSR